MANTIKVSYTRRFTTKREDGSFESLELGGETEVELGEVEGTDDINAAWNQLHDAFVETVETKALEDAEGTVAVHQPAPEPAPKQDRLASWVKKSVDENTKKFRPQTQAKTLPGERFTKPPREEAEVEQPQEGEAVAYEDVRVFLDNKQTKIDKTKRGKKYGMLRLGKTGEIPGEGYVTGKSFEPEIVEQIEAVIEAEAKYVDVYGYFEPRNNDPEVFDLVIQGVAPSQR